MNTKTLKALRGSIRKWEKIVAGTGTDEGVDNCPLCKLFHKETWDDLSCAGCPVFLKTGRHGCDGTPYEQYTEEEESTANALKELRFLRSLLPKKGKRK